jgi:FkbM family methyltransferase
MTITKEKAQQMPFLWRTDDFHRRNLLPCVPNMRPPIGEILVNLRHLAERFSRGLILRRRLSRQFQSLPLYVSPEASLRHWGWNMEAADPMLFRMVRELVRPGDVVWDVGANVGLFSFSAAALAGPDGFVLAIEPDVWLAHLLTRSSQGIHREAPQAAPVAVLCAAASEASRIGQLQIAQRARAANYLLEATGGYRYQQPTVTVSLDFLLDYFPAPSVLKIDVETAEVEVLRGAPRLLSTICPVIWCEVAAENSEIVAELLHQGPYELHPAAAEPTKRRPLTRAPWDTLAVPKGWK